MQHENEGNLLKAPAACGLIAEVRQSLVSTDPEALRDELSELGLLPYCQSALSKLDSV